MIRELIILFATFVSHDLYADQSVTNPKKVLISQVVEHPALNKTTQGIIAGLAQNGFVQDQNLDLRVESAQANSALAMQIANKFISQKPDVVVGVGTISAQSFVKSAKQKNAKLIFSSVTDPIAANLQSTSTQNLTNISGVTNFVPLEPQLQLFKKIQPNLNRLGIIFNPGEINSVSMVNQLETVCTQMNITLVKQAATKTADVAQAATRLSASVDAIFISNDNTALSSLSSIVNAAQKNQIPVYVSDTDAVATGALAALGPNQYEVGLQTGYMIAQVLNSKDINEFEITRADKTELVINLQAAQKLNLTIPPEVLTTANQIIGAPS